MNSSMTREQWLVRLIVAHENDDDTREALLDSLFELRRRTWAPMLPPTRPDVIERRRIAAYVAPAPYRQLALVRS